MLKSIKSAIIYNKNIPELYKCQRFKGHSKWQNIRHIKAAKDLEKSGIAMHYVKQMRIAIAEMGGIMDPEKNDKLARVIEQAKKAEMPHENIKNSLKKIKDRKLNSEIKYIAIRGPSGSCILVQLLTDNMIRTRMVLNTVARKCNISIMDSIPKGMFIHKGIIITNMLKDINSATDDAILCDAEEVDEINDDNDKYLQFVCDPKKLHIVKSKLEQHKYEVIKCEEQYIPKHGIEVNKEAEEAIDKLYTRLNAIEDVSQIYSNIL